MPLDYNHRSMVDDVMRYIVDHIRNTVYARYDHQRTSYSKFKYSSPYAYMGLDSREVESAIHAVVSNPEKLARLLLEDHNLKSIIEMAEGEKQREAKQLERSENMREEAHNNGIEHEKYEEALEILDEFAEIGVENLDEEQQELYDEALEIVQKYENS